MAFAVGLNSGSSLDSIDAVVIEIERGADGLPTKPRVVATAETPWPAPIRDLLLRAINGEADVHEVSRLNFAAGYAYGEAAKDVVAAAGLKPADVLVVGVDGQTLSMAGPRREDLTGDPVADYLSGAMGHTLQTGDGSVIATTCGIDVVSQFRPADIALGGNGAPIEQYLDYILYRDVAPLITLNIGGIANIHAVGGMSADTMMCFDTGPGNILIDRFVQSRFDVGYDKDGAIAARGTVDKVVLDRLLDHPFMKRKPPRSAWREDFDQRYLEALLAAFPAVQDVDMAATLTEFTARTIVEALSHVPFLDKVKLFVGNGGGLFNGYLRGRIEALMPKHLKLILSDEFGIPAKANEAAKFATLGFAHINGMTGNFPSSSGARVATVLGKHHLHPPAP